MHVVDFAHGAAVREWRGHKREVNRLALLQVILREPQRPAHTNLEKQATTRNVASPSNRCQSAHCPTHPDTTPCTK